MKVLLAGYNIDSTVIEELKSKSCSRDDVTPETLSAAYARISRDPRPIDELRAVARAEVEKARRSNRTIIFKMGHHSVAEHAVFNFDIIGISRLAMEEIEKFRLGSFTEKSQRYVKLEDDFVVPEEVKEAGRESDFIKTVHEQNVLYHKLYDQLKPYMFQKNPEMAADKKKHSVLDGLAKEDARYVLSLATQGQLGMTLNARNLEHLIRRFASKEFAELREVNQRIYKLAKGVAPSIILFTDANNFDAKTYKNLEQRSADWVKPEKRPLGDSVQLVEFTKEADTKLVAALLHSTSLSSYKQCLKKARTLSHEDKLDLVKTAFQYMEFYDAVLREFEHIDLIFDLIVSASCFAQLKRHRIATLTVQKYNPELGVVIPPSIEKIGMKSEFLEVIEKTNKVYYSLKKALEVGAEYILTNAHQRRVLFKTNARELYHFSRLREDSTAQWDIRSLAKKMRQASAQVMPLTCLLLGGKGAYPETYQSLFNKLPCFLPPED